MGIENKNNASKKSSTPIDMDNSYIVADQSDGNMFSIFDYSPIPILIYNLETFKLVHVNQTAIAVYGYSYQEFLNLTIKAIRPQSDMDRFLKTNEAIKKSTGPLKVGTYPHLRKDGTIMQMDLTVQKIPFLNESCVLVSGTDVTEKDQINALDRLERDVMERSLDTEYELTHLLNDYTKGLEKIFPDMRASILRIDGNKLFNYASPSLSSDYVNAINGLEFGPFAGSCGTAAYSKKRVIVSDIANDPLWADYKALAIPNNLRACWSQPVFNGDKKVVATFANYYEKVKEPTQSELELFSRSASLLGLILENRRKSSALVASNELFNYVNMATNDAIYDWDLSTDQIIWGHSFERIFGYPKDQHPVNLSERLKLIHGVYRSKIEDSIKILLANPQENRWKVQYRLKKANGIYCIVEDKGFIIRDHRGKGLRMIGVINDITKQETEAIKIKIRASFHKIFGNDHSLVESLNLVTKLFAAEGNYSITEIWLANMDQTKLNLFSHYANDALGEHFYKESIELQNLEIGQGLPGNVWEKNSSILWKAVSENKMFMRRQAAHASKLVDMIGLPLVQKNKIIGVLCLGTGKVKNNFKDIPKILGDLTSLLAGEIKRKQVETELEQLINTAPNIICQLDFEGQFKRINEAGCQLLGYSEKELLKLPSHLLIFQDDLEKTQECLVKLKNENNIFKSQNRYITKEGKIIWLSWTCNPSHEEGLIYAVAKNITEEKSLANLLDVATEMARIGSWEVDLVTNKIYWSKITRDIHGVDESYEPDLEKGINFYRKDVQPIIMSSITDSIKNGTPWDLELPIITRQGNEVWVRAIGKAEYKDDKCIRIFGSFQDINARKTTELRLKAISNNLPGVIFQYNLFPDGTDKLNFVSDGSIELWGMTPEECMVSTEKVWERIGEAGDLEILKQSIIDSAETLMPWQCIWRHRTEDGLVRWNEGKGKPTKLADGTVVWDSLIIDITNRKELEQGLERATKLARIGSWEIDADLNGEILCSPMTRTLLEVEEQYKLTYKNALSFYYGAHKPEVEKAVQELVQFGKKIDTELQIKTGKGNIKWIRVIGESEYLDGKTNKVFGSIQDIHNLKEGEFKLKNTLREKNEILERIGDGFFAVDLQWNVIYWNTVASDILTIDKHEIVGANLWDIFSDAPGLPNNTRYHMAMNSGAALHFEDYYEPINKWFEVSAYPSNSGLSVYFKDVSDRKLADLEIKKGFERFEKVTEATSDAIYEWDIKENTLFWGEGFKTLFGYTAEKGSPTLDSWSSHLHPEDKDWVTSSLENMLVNENNNHWQEEYRYLKEDGTYSNVLDKGVLIRDENGKPVRMVGAMSDITARKRYEKSLKDINLKLEQHARKLAMSNEELEQFAYMASHDLQEPLRMVTSFLTQLERKYSSKLDDKAHQYIDFAVDGAKRMRTIILDLLEYSRVGKDDQELELVDLNEIVKGILFAQQQIIKDNRIHVHVEDLPTINAYNSPLIQVFHNLISNAIKFRKKDIDSKIEIRCKEYKKHWEFLVKDNGIGINKDYFPKIFLIFQRLHSREDYSGTGIGLSIVKKIVENFGGTLWVKSKENKGSKFYFTIPKKININ